MRVSSRTTRKYPEAVPPSLPALSITESNTLFGVVRTLRPTGRGPEVAEVPPDQCPNGHRLGGG